MFGGKGFSFGTPTTTSSSAGTTPGFSFGSQPATASPSTGFTLGGTPAAGTAQTGGFKFGGTPASGATTGFSFGSTSTPATATSTPAASQGFGGFSQPATGGFGLATTAAPASTSAPGFAGFGGLGGTPASATTAATAPSFSLGGAAASTGNPTLSGLLGTPKTTASTAPALGLGGTPQTTATTASAFIGLKTGAAPASTATGGFSFAKPGTATTTAATTSAAPSTLGGFGFGTAAPASSAAATSSAPSAGGFNFGSGTGTAATSSTASGTSLASTVPGTQMTYRQLEDQINKWMGDLESQEKVFLQQATQVNAWDRLLVDNGEKITQLNGDMERVKVDQGKLEQELEFIKSQQRELEDLIIPLEKSMEQLPSSSLQPHHADLERENTYQLADNIDSQLKRMVQDLKEIIDHLNTSSSGQDTNDPILQITKILNAHMDSLQWIDNNSALLGRRVEDISKQMENQKKDQERNFRLVYD